MHAKHCKDHALQLTEENKINNCEFHDMLNLVQIYDMIKRTSCKVVTSVLKE